jgi:hypothetical protein
MPRGAPLFDDVAGVHGTTAAFEKVANAEDGDLEMSDGAIRARAASASVASPSSGISGRSDDAGMGGKTSTSSSRAEVHVDGMGDDDDDETFSWRKFAKFLGPGFLMCIGYVDPGNFESDLQAGCLFGYSLLWVILWATACGLFIQALAVRLALATGWHLSRVMRDEYSNPARYALWFITELAIVASDVPEVIGTALALKLLFGIPTVIGVAITSASTLVFLLLQQLGVRKLEAFMVRSRRRSRSPPLAPRPDASSNRLPRTVHITHRPPIANPRVRVINRIDRHSRRARSWASSRFASSRRWASSAAATAKR